MTRSDVGKGHPDYYQDMAERLAGEIPGAFYVNQFANPANPLAHETTTGPEIWEQMDHDVDAVVCGVGSGGTLTGLGRYFAKVSPKTEMVLADPVGSVLAPLVKTGKMTEAGSWMVEGIGEDFVPPNGDLSLVATAYHDLRRGEHRWRRALLREGGHPGRLVLRHAARRGAALLPRADDAEARRHLRLRQRQQIPVEGVQRFLAGRAGLPRPAAFRRSARPDHAALRPRATVTVGPDDTLLTAYNRMRPPTSRSCRCSTTASWSASSTKATSCSPSTAMTSATSAEKVAGAMTARHRPCRRRRWPTCCRSSRGTQVAMVCDGDTLRRPDHPHRPDQPFARGIAEPHERRSPRRPASAPSRPAPSMPASRPTRRPARSWCRSTPPRPTRRRARACTRATNIRAARTRRAWPSSAASPTWKAAAPASPSPPAWRRSPRSSSCSTAARMSSPPTTSMAAPSACSTGCAERSAGLEFSFVDLTDLAARRGGDPPGDPHALGRDADQPAAEAGRPRGAGGSPAGAGCSRSPTTPSPAPRCSGRSSSASTSSCIRRPNI